MPDRNKFTDKTEYIKVESDFSNREKMGFYESSGEFSVSGDKIQLTSMLRTWYEKEFPQLAGTENKAQNVLDSCSYVIKGDELIFKYTSYPLDAPVKTEMAFKRMKD